MTMKAEFVSEVIRPVAGAGDSAGMVRGEPGFPKRFIWRETEYVLAEVLATWKQSGPCKSGSNEKYLRKHWFRIRTADGVEMEIYFDRQARSKRQAKNRWWLYTVSKPE